MELITLKLISFNKSIEHFLKAFVRYLSLPLAISFIHAGEHHCSAIDEHGVLYMWGDNEHGQCGPSK